MYSSRSFGKYIVLILLVMLFNILTNYIKFGIYNTKMAGDEPYYMVMTSAISDYCTFEQSKAYTKEYYKQNFFSHKISDSPPKMGEDYGHALYGSNGLYSIHNIGLPLLLTPAYNYLPINGIKSYLILLSSFIIILLWIYLSLLTNDQFVKVLTVFTAFFALPFLTAVNQIYASILSGAISLAAILWVLYRPKFIKERRYLYDLLILGIISFQPWLQIKFFAPAFIATIAIILDSFRTGRSYSKAALMPVPLLLSTLLLAFYNDYAFGNIYGPYSQGSLEISLNSLMVLLGLHLDQFQGIFMQNPIMFIGILFLVPYFRWNWRVGLLTLLLYASLIVPNAMHPNWYGGGSYAGRFAVASAVIFLLPILFGLLQLKKINHTIFYFVIALSVSVQTLFLYKLSSPNFSLYNQKIHILEGVMTFYSPLNNYFPSFSNVSWAFKYGTNYAYIFFLLFLIYIGSFYGERDSKSFGKYTKYFLFSFAVLVFAGIASSSTPPVFKKKTFPGSGLPSVIGEKNGSFITAKEGSTPGYITFGPYIQLSKGVYEFDILYSSSEENKTVVGSWNIAVYFPEKPKELKKGSIIGTGYKDAHIIETFEISKEIFNKEIEIRNYYNGTGDLTLKSLTIKKIK